MQTIKTLTTPDGQALVNVPAQLSVLLELGFDAQTAQALLAPDMDALKAAKVAAIRQRRDALTEDYIVIDGKHYHSDPKSRIQQMGLAKTGRQQCDTAWLAMDDQERRAGHHDQRDCPAI